MAAQKSPLSTLEQELGKITWKVSPKLGLNLPYTETSDAWYFNKKGTNHVYVQPKTPQEAPTHCYCCKTNVASVELTVTNWSKSGPGPCAGVDNTLEKTYFCPTCEKRPHPRTTFVP